MYKKYEIRKTKVLVTLHFLTSSLNEPTSTTVIFPKLKLKAFILLIRDSKYCIGFLLFDIKRLKTFSSKQKCVFRFVSKSQPQQPPFQFLSTLFLILFSLKKFVLKTSSPSSLFVVKSFY